MVSIFRKNDKTKRLNVFFVCVLFYSTDKSNPSNFFKKFTSTNVGGFRSLQGPLLSWKRIEHDGLWINLIGNLVNLIVIDIIENLLSF